MFDLVFSEAILSNKQLANEVVESIGKAKVDSFSKVLTPPGSILWLRNLCRNCMLLDSDVVSQVD